MSVPGSDPERKSKTYGSYCIARGDEFVVVIVDQALPFTVELPDLYAFPSQPS